MYVQWKLDCDALVEGQDYGVRVALADQPAISTRART
jgi:hypothetical protein